MTRQDHVWPLQDAKARLSEMVRRARDEGPQFITVHGKPAAKVIGLDGDWNGKEGETGETPVVILGRSPLRLLGEGEFARSRMPARNRRLRP
jgi:prevent-host-death family protein